jgi:hypothetical protein
MTSSNRGFGMAGGAGIGAAKPVLPMTRTPTGCSFEVAELLMLRAWAEWHDLRLVIELDHCIDGDEYEEVIALYPPESPLREWTVWRSACAIIVVPMHGRSIRFETISDVLHALLPTTG